MPEVAVQIVNYATKAHLVGCLRSVVADLAAGPADAPVLVLDNASGDDLSDLAAAYAGRVTFETAEENLGFGAGHNRLAARHDAATLLLLNPDAELVEPSTVARLLAVLGQEAGAVAVGPRLVGPGGAVEEWDHGELYGVRARISGAAGHSHWRRRAARTDVAWVSGASMLVRRAAFDAAGGFDPGFFLYKEDEDLCLRLRQAGGRVVYEPAITVCHTALGAGRGPHLERSIARFRDKHVGRGRRVALAARAHRTAAVWEGRMRKLLGRRA